MKKIKTVKLKKEINTGTYIILIDSEAKYEKEECIYYFRCSNKYLRGFTESEILANAGAEGTQTFQVEFEDENFGIEIPDYKTLKSGYHIITVGLINKVSILDIYSEEDLQNIYLSGNWFESYEEAVIEAKRRKIKFALNKLRDEANEKFPIKECSSYVLLIVYEVNIISYNVGNSGKGLFGFNNYNAVDYFKTKLNQSPELKAGLIELLERGSL